MFNSDKQLGFVWLHSIVRNQLHRFLCSFNITKYLKSSLHVLYEDSDGIISFFHTKRCQMLQIIRKFECHEHVHSIETCILNENNILLKVFVCLICCCTNKVIRRRLPLPELYGCLCNYMHVTVESAAMIHNSQTNDHKYWNVISYQKIGYRMIVFCHNFLSLSYVPFTIYVGT